MCFRFLFRSNYTTIKISKKLVSPLQTAHLGLTLYWKESFWIYHVDTEYGFYFNS